MKQTLPNFHRRVTLTSDVWKEVSIGFSAGVGAGANAFSGFGGKSHSIQLTPSKPTNSRSLWDIRLNWYQHSPSMFPSLHF